jgi:hypothetical protein
MSKVKVSFEMDFGDYELLCDILQSYVVKHVYEPPCDLDMDKAKKDWMIKHGKYVENKILKKIADGRKK